MRRTTAMRCMCSNSPKSENTSSKMPSMLPLLMALWPLHSCFAVAFRIEAKWADLSRQAELVRPTPPRSGHVAFTSSDEPYSPLVFGGYVEEKDDATGEITRRASNDMWEWRGSDKGWRKVDYGKENVMPQPRLAAAMCLVRDRPVLFGGWDPQTPGTGGIILDTLEEFDTKSKAWNAIDGGHIPGGSTSRHVALSLPDGDALIHNHRCTDHVLIYSGSDFHKQPVTGQAPSSRGLHAATMAGSNAVIFGGAEQSGTMNNEVFVLDTHTWAWKQIQVESTDCAPCPRAAPCLVAMSNNCIVLYGGAEATASGLNPRGDLWALHFDPDAGAGKWELLIDDGGGGTNTVGGCPPPRNAATLSEIEQSEGAWNEPSVEGEIRKCFVLQGGWHPFVRTYNDCFVLSISLKR